MCGGTEYYCNSGIAIKGLSPRVRGNPMQQCVDVPFAWSIPACAGEPPTARLSCQAEAVYPRVCGGTSAVGFLFAPVQGLSPRVRGNRAAQLVGSTGSRSIPACAGEPLLAPSPLTPLTVYPRVCGGTQAPCRTAPKRRGLSPRVRGNLWLSCLIVNGVGSIPACAGEPAFMQQARHFVRVYPRVCGGTFRLSA